VLKILLTLIGGLNLLFCFAQKNYGVRQDYYMYQNEQSVIVPLVYYETKNNWYTSLRYNYEEAETFSFQLGKNFSKEGVISYSVTPLAGLLGGKFKGASIGMQAEIELGNFSFYSEPEYCTQFNSAENFFYNWSELSVQLSKFFYTGLALQTIRVRQERGYVEPGIMFGATIRNFELPFYFFRPSVNQQYFVAGIHWRLRE
jgi:hypothetical protein